MPAGYDSWTDDIPGPPVPADRVERGHGYAIGGTGRAQSVRTRGRWRADLAQLLRLALIDLALCLIVGLFVFLAAYLRSISLGITALVLLMFAGFFFKHQRWHHERRPR